MSKHFAAAATCFTLFCSSALAEGLSDPLAWLSRISSAAQELNYSGTFTYQTGRIFETSRITHVNDDHVERERLEVLDGSPRQVIRQGDTVWCVLPERKTVITDHSVALQRVFPGRLPLKASRIAENYTVSRQHVSRVAGLDAQLIVLDPRDDLRYGHMLWADVATGLLLKANMIDEAGATIEQFKFNNVQIGSEVALSGAEPPQLPLEEGWTLVSAQGDNVEDADGWRLSEPLPGFELEFVVRRPLGRDQRDVMHMVYGDGLTSISVFIEPDADVKADRLGMVENGAINIYRRAVEGHLLTALGEVPPRAVKRIAHAMEREQ